MALYLGDKLIAGSGGSGNANIVSCDNYEDYLLKLAANIAAGKLSVSYYTPDEGGGVFPTALPDYAVLFGGNSISRSNDISVLNTEKLSAAHNLSEGMSLDDKSLIMTDETGSYNVNYSQLFSQLSQIHAELALTATELRETINLLIADKVGIPCSAHKLNNVYVDGSLFLSITGTALSAIEISCTIPLYKPSSNAWSARSIVWNKDYIGTSFASQMMFGYGVSLTTPPIYVLKSYNDSGTEKNSHNYSTELSGIVSILKLASSNKISCFYNDEHLNLQTAKYGKIRLFNYDSTALTAYTDHPFDGKVFSISAIYNNGTVIEYLPYLKVGVAILHSNGNGDLTYKGSGSVLIIN